jgi:hypothetical protein
MPPAKGLRRTVYTSGQMLEIHLKTAKNGHTSEVLARSQRAPTRSISRFISIKYDMIAGVPTRGKTMWPRPPETASAMAAVVHYLSPGAEIHGANVPATGCGRQTPTGESPTDNESRNNWPAQPSRLTKRRAGGCITVLPRLTERSAIGVPAARIDAPENVVDNYRGRRATAGPPLIKHLFHPAGIPKRGLRKSL